MYVAFLENHPIGVSNCSGLLLKRCMAGVSPELMEIKSIYAE